MTLFLYTCFAYSPFVYNVNTRYKVGWVSMGIFILNLSINLLVAVRAIIQGQI